MVNRDGHSLTEQFLEVTINRQEKYPLIGNCKEIMHPYAIWHNQKTGKFTFRTECGFFSVPEADVLEIKLLQTKLPFED